MIQFQANRKQFLQALSELLAQNDMEIELERNSLGENGRVYDIDEIAFTIFRQEEAWMVFIRNTSETSLALLVAQHHECTICYRIELYDDAPTRLYPNDNVLDWVQGATRFFNQLDWYDGVLADRMYNMIHNRDGGIQHHTVVVGQRRKDRQTKVQMLFHGTESSRVDRTVLVFRVTNNVGRDDIYSACVKTQTRTLNYFMGLYKREVYSKFLRELLDREGVNHDVLGVYQAKPGEVVCISRPVANDRATYDTKLEVGRSYPLVSEDRDCMDQNEWVTILVGGAEYQYNALHFFKVR